MISVIVCSRDDTKFSMVNAMYRRLCGGASLEVIRIPDAKGMSEGYNRGIFLSRGEILIFCHDDIEILAVDFYERLLGHMEHADVIGIAGTTRLCSGRWDSAGPPYLYGQVAHPNPKNGYFELNIWSVPTRRVLGMQAMDGLFLCCQRDCALQLRFDEQVFRNFHFYDIDFTYRAALAGYRLAVCNDFNVIHLSQGNWDKAWAEDEHRFAQKHQSTLIPYPKPPQRSTLVAVPNREHLFELMHPPHWDQKAL